MLNTDFGHSLTKFLHHTKLPLACIAIVSSLLLVTLISFIGIFKKPKALTTHIHQLSYQKQNGQEIATQHLFGNFQEKVSAPVTPVTPLNLSLEAVFYSESRSQKSGALISQIGQPAMFYYEGDRLPNGAYIKQIFPDKVMIDNRGSTQTLELPIPKLEFAPPPE